MYSFLIRSSSACLVVVSHVGLKQISISNKQHYKIAGRDFDMESTVILEVRRFQSQMGKSQWVWRCSKLCVFFNFHGMCDVMHGFKSVRSDTHECDVDLCNKIWNFFRFPSTWCMANIVTRENVFVIVIQTPKKRPTLAKTWWCYITKCSHLSDC